MIGRFHSPYVSIDHGVIIVSLRFCSDSQKAPMLNIDIKSYDSHFDTFACVFTDSLNEAVFDSLLPATLLPYVAPKLCDETEDLPYGLVGQSFTMTRP